MIMSGMESISNNRILNNLLKYLEKNRNAYEKRKDTRMVSTNADKRITIV
jgi:hypothetical protein